jgi:hypothetical protein
MGVKYRPIRIDLSMGLAFSLCVLIELQGNTMHTATTDQHLSDKTFLTQFESKTLDPVHFSHLGHIRLAWLYLNRMPLDTALEKVCSGINSYAISLGANSKFHLTITDALVRIIAKRINASDDKSWSFFLEQNNDLISDAQSILAQHFSEKLLFSEVARSTLVEPDLKSL